MFVCIYECINQSDLCEIAHLLMNVLYSIYNITLRFQAVIRKIRGEKLQN